MNSLDKIKADFQKGRMNINDIGWVIQQLEMEKHKNKQQSEELKTLKTKKWFTVYKENLALAQELETVKTERDEYKDAFDSLRLATPDRRIREHA